MAHVGELPTEQRRIAAALLGLPESAGEGMALVRLVRQRLPAEVIANLERAGLSKRAVRAIIPQRTLEHRRARGEPLSIEESERALRTASVLALAEAVFEDRVEALNWMTTPKHRFDDEAPMELLDTDIGARLVEDMLIQIDEGYFA